MADKTIFGRLQKLFSTSTIVRKTTKGVKVVDTDEYQNMTTNLVDRFMKMRVTNFGNGALESSMAYQWYTKDDEKTRERFLAICLGVFKNSLKPKAN